MQQAVSIPRRITNVQDMSQVQQLLWARPVFWNLFTKTVRVRYRRTMLGFFWSLINPTLNLIIYSFVFTLVFQVRMENYVVHLMAGLLPFHFFRNTVSMAADTLVSGARFFKKQFLPKMIFPIVGLCGNLVDFLLAYAVLLTVGNTFLGFKLAPAQLFLPISLLLIVAFTLGCALIMSIAGTYFADLQHIFNVVIQTVLYGTPVLYSMDMVPEKLQPYLKLNPMYYFITNFTLPLYYHQVPDLTQILVSTVLAVGALVAGIALFLKYESEVIFRV
ncbi:MAG: ABC transporter permease [Desulfomonile sp.]|nr:ABC transporter permease [Desulfomonile sp.]